MMSEFDALPVPMMSPKDVVKYVWDRFPSLQYLFSDPDNIDPSVAEPYNSYSRLVEEMLREQEDTVLLAGFASLINDMANSGEYWLAEILGDMFETIAMEQKFLANLSPYLSERAKDKLKGFLR